MNSNQQQKKQPRGVFEKEPGSGVWWIRYTDSEGRYRREKAGTKSAAIMLYPKRKTEALQGKKLPETLRLRVVRFAELAEDALEYVKRNNQGQEVDTYRIKVLKAQFGERPADISIEELRRWFDAQVWKPGTFNRYRTVLSGIFRLGIENNKVMSNPVRLLKHRQEPDGRVRFLNQFPPLLTKADYLKPLKDEQTRLMAVIAADYPQHAEEFIIAINTGMRRSEQYRRIDWSCIDVERKDLAIPQSKTGAGRHIPLNAEARAAFARLRKRTISEGPIFLGKGGERVLGPRHWFEDAVKKAGIRSLTWHDLRHTFASRLVMAGVDITTVRDLMGHKKVQMTMRYAHLAPQHKLDAVERLSVYNPDCSFNSFISYHDKTSEHGSLPSKMALLEVATDTTTDTKLEKAVLAEHEEAN
jgi:integrase